MDDGNRCSNNNALALMLLSIFKYIRGLRTDIDVVIVTEKISGKGEQYSFDELP